MKRKMIRVIITFSCNYRYFLCRFFLGTSLVIHILSFIFKSLSLSLYPVPLFSISALSPKKSKKHGFSASVLGFFYPRSCLSSTIYLFFLPRDMLHLSPLGRTRAGSRWYHFTATSGTQMHIQPASFRTFPPGIKFMQETLGLFLLWYVMLNITFFERKNGTDIPN